LLNLVANYFLIQSYGGLGAMIGTQFANACACATESFLTARWIGQSLQPIRSLAILAIASVSVLTTYFLTTLLPPTLTPLLRLLLAGTLMTVLTIAGYTIFKIPEAHKVLGKFRSLFGST
jgi:hypothetical protein